MLETKWGLGLKHLDDMPPQNIYNFGLVRLQFVPLEARLTNTGTIHRSTVVGEFLRTRKFLLIVTTAISRAS